MAHVEEGEARGREALYEEGAFEELERFEGLGKLEFYFKCKKKERKRDVREKEEKEKKGGNGRKKRRRK